MAEEFDADKELEEVKHKKELIKIHKKQLRLGDNMKKIFKWVLTIALFLLVGAIIYIMISNKKSFDEALELVFVGAGSIGTALVVLIPIFDKIQKSHRLIETATNITGTQNSELEKLVKEFKEQKLNYEKNVSKQSQEIQEMKQVLNNVKDICKMGFVNNKELVSKGIASEIAKVGEVNENNESEK